VHAFHEYRPSGHQRFTVVPKKFPATLMIGITAIHQGQPCAGIHQDHGFSPHLFEKSIRLL
jgi:hypothetical protein